MEIMNCLLPFQLGEHYDFAQSGDLTYCRFNQEQHQINTSIHPQHCATAMMVVKQMEKTLPVATAQMINAVNQCHVPGRLQWLAREPMWLLDVAHNMQAVQRLYNEVASKMPLGKIYFVFGVFN